MTSAVKCSRETTRLGLRRGSGCETRRGCLKGQQRSHWAAGFFRKQRRPRRTRCTKEEGALELEELEELFQSTESSEAVAERVIDCAFLDEKRRGIGALQKLWCYGCGVQLQSEEVDRIGFITPSKLETKVKYKQYNQVTSPLLWAMSRT